jgi:transposase
MLAPDLAKWQQKPKDLFELGLHAPHARTRERYLALFHLAVYGGGATDYAQQTGRDRITVMDWVREYNAAGPAALTYERTGGSHPLFQNQNASN